MRAAPALICVARSGGPVGASIALPVKTQTAITPWVMNSVWIGASVSTPEISWPCLLSSVISTCCGGAVAGRALEHLGDLAPVCRAAADR